MLYAKTYIGSKNVRTVLFGTFLAVLFIFIITYWNNESLLSNCFYNDDQIIAFSKQEVDLSFDSWTGVQLLEYLKWPNQKTCERVGYFGGKILKNDYEAFMDGQKAVCLDNGTVPSFKNCLVYSIGINDEWDFDEAMETYGCQVSRFISPLKENQSHQIDVRSGCCILAMLFDN